MISFLDIARTIFHFFADTSWAWLPFVLAAVFFETWMYYIQRVYWQGIKWVVLEIKPPRDIQQSPKIMEQVFAGFWGIFGTISTKYEKYLKGVLQDYLCFEIVGVDGSIHFFVRAPEKYRNMIESQIYGQYPQTEIREVEDYVGNVPADIPNKNWTLWGCRMTLAKEDSYPIRTYAEQVEVISGPKIPLFIDPLAGLMEVFSKLRSGEQIWIQILIRPVADNWVEKSKVLVKKLMAEAAPAAGEEGGTSMPILSPGLRETLTLIENKASKKAFESKIQFAYLARKELYSPPNIGASMGLFNQFASLNGNVLRPETQTITKAFYFLAKQRKIYKQRKIIRMLKQRSYWEKGYILNIEELASLYHFPTTGVKAPMTPWLEIKKAEPPLGLPTE